MGKHVRFPTCANILKASFVHQLITNVIALPPSITVRLAINVVNTQITSILSNIINTIRKYFNYHIYLIIFLKEAKSDYQGYCENDSMCKDNLNLYCSASICDCLNPLIWDGTTCS